MLQCTRPERLYEGRPRRYHTLQLIEAGIELLIEFLYHESIFLEHGHSLMGRGKFIYIALEVAFSQSPKPCSPVQNIGVIVGVG